MFLNYSMNPIIIHFGYNHFQSINHSIIHLINQTIIQAFNQSIILDQSITKTFTQSFTQSIMLSTYIWQSAWHSLWWPSSIALVPPGIDTRHHHWWRHSRCADCRHPYCDRPAQSSAGSQVSPAQSPRQNHLWSIAQRRQRWPPRSASSPRRPQALADHGAWCEISAAGHGRRAAMMSTAAAAASTEL